MSFDSGLKFCFFLGPTYCFDALCRARSCHLHRWSCLDIMHTGFHGWPWMVRRVVAVDWLSLALTIVLCQNKKKKPAPASTTVVLRSAPGSAVVYLV